jgi:hypothetical protein
MGQRSSDAALISGHVSLSVEIGVITSPDSQGELHAGNTPQCWRLRYGSLLASLNLPGDLVKFLARAAAILHV